MHSRTYNRPYPGCPDHHTNRREIDQNLIDLDIDRIEIKQTKISNLDDDADLRAVAERNEGRTLGLAATYLESGDLKQLAIADAKTVIVLDFKKNKNNECGRERPWEDDENDNDFDRQNGNGRRTRRGTPLAGLSYLHAHILRRETGFLCAFNLPPLALALWYAVGLRLQGGVDMQSLQYVGENPNPNRKRVRDPCVMIGFAVDGEAKLHRENIRQTFEDEVYRVREADPVIPLAQRAWVAHYVSQLETMEHRFKALCLIDMDRISHSMLQFCAKSTRDAFALREQRPREMKVAVIASYDRQTREVDARTKNYQDRIYSGGDQRVSLQVSSANGSYTIPASITTTNSMGARFRVDRDLAGRRVTHVILTGRDDPSGAEVERAQVILMILQGVRAPAAKGVSPWVDQIFFQPGDDFRWPGLWSNMGFPITFYPGNMPRPLNPLQIKAIKHMLNQGDDSRITIIQGPPGTGKTTVIASYVLTAVTAGKRGLWLIAKTNIALKNMAEKLMDFGLSNWKLLVSKRFHDIWHEHYYDKIRPHVITSDNFEDKQEFLRHFTDSPVMLCTLDMLSVAKLKRLGVFRHVPLQTVVVDEASQIEIGEYIPLFFNNSSIRKMTFVGDDKQLPPHGQGLSGELKTIFEVEHLDKHRIFLNTQYRMPPQIGNFISASMYEDRLNSCPDHPLGNSLIDTDHKTCHFVNAPGTQLTQDKSFKNPEECRAIVELAHLFQLQNKRFKILTPYAAQTSLIESQLRDAGLVWAGTCFNVDSFQGNEEDYILISLVRSLELGFLDDVRRTNVMLTRCKRGMIIFTSKSYMRKYGAGSLVGALLEYYDDNIWLEVQEMQQTEFV